MPKPIRVAVLGATGRMGRELIDCIVVDPGLRLAAAVAAAGDPRIGQDAGAAVGQAPLGVPVSEDLAAAATACDVLVDFSRPEATRAALEVCRVARRPLVIGTTGLDAATQAALPMASAEIPICRAANFSVGVNLCLALLERAAAVLGEDYDTEIFEAHHRYKVDAPSGTALALGEVIAAVRGRKLEEIAVWQRHGQVGERAAGAIGFSVLRGGDLVGEHAVIFAGSGERVELRHIATSRANFARGALRAAAWLVDRPPGSYDMRDVLGLR